MLPRLNDGSRLRPPNIPDVRVERRSRLSVVNGRPLETELAITNTARGRVDPGEVTFERQVLR